VSRARAGTPSAREEKGSHYRGWRRSKPPVIPGVPLRSAPRASGSQSSSTSIVIVIVVVQCAAVWPPVRVSERLHLRTSRFVHTSFRFPCVALQTRMALLAASKLFVAFWPTAQASFSSSRLLVDAAPAVWLQQMQQRSSEWSPARPPRSSKAKVGLHTPRCAFLRPCVLQAKVRTARSWGPPKTT
jgi:hypothetical protein